MARKPKEGAVCVYCGRHHQDITEEHVVPRGLYDRPLAAGEQWIKVWTCRPCNGNKAENDVYLIHALISDHRSQKNKTAQRLLKGRFIRAAKRGQSDIARAALTQGRFKPMLSRGGVYLGHGYNVPLEVERINSVFSLMVRGLYYHFRQQLIPQDALFDVRVLRDEEEVKGCWEMFNGMRDKGFLNGPYLLGEDEFLCAFLYYPDLYTSFWFIGFYDSVFFTVATSPPRHGETSDFP